MAWDSFSPTIGPLSSFTPFPRLPTELRLKIWQHFYNLIPPQHIPLYLCKSDLHYLQLRRKACHDYLHIYAGRMRHVPALLHICRESRSIGLKHYSLGFDIFRILSMGRGELDRETYTTCSHETTMDEVGRGVYWDKEKDVVVLENGEWTWAGVDGEAAAYIWGGKTGIKFGKMRRVAMSYESISEFGTLNWEGIDILYVLISEEHLRTNVWSWGNSPVSMEGYIQKFLRGRGLSSSEGNPVDVRCVVGSLDGFMNAEALARS